MLDYRTAMSVGVPGMRSKEDGHRESHCEAEARSKWLLLKWMDLY